MLPESMAMAGCQRVVDREASGVWRVVGSRRGPTRCWGTNTSGPTPVTAWSALMVSTGLPDDCLFPAGSLGSLTGSARDSSRSDDPAVVAEVALGRCVCVDIFAYHV